MHTYFLFLGRFADGLDHIMSMLCEQRALVLLKAVINTSDLYMNRASLGARFKEGWVTLSSLENSLTLTK